MALWIHSLGLLFAYFWLPSPIAPKSFHKLEEIIASNKLVSLYNSSSNLFSLTSKPNVEQLSYYGDSCDDNNDCAIHFGLSCSNSTCICSSPEFIARFSPEKSLGIQRRTECVLRAGSKCGIHLTSGYRTNLENAAFFWNKLKRNVPFLSEIAESSPPCTTNARCIGGICRCSGDHFRDHRGLCLRKRTIFQPCEKDGQCRATEGLQCSEGKCQCIKSMVFDRVKRKCFIPVGGECDAYSSTAEMECVSNADCSNDRCECRSGYVQSSDGGCGIAHGGLCDMHTNICSDIQLTCRSGRCQCRYPIHQVYNETLGQCLGKADGPCIPLSPSCVPFGECVKSNYADDAMFDFVCKCVNGFAEDTSGNCGPSYSSECLEDDDCDQAVGQLTCVNGKCACPDEMLVWDEAKRKCLGVVGARCKFIQLERILNFRMDVPTECISNAVCVEHVAILDGRCECKIGYQFSKAQLKCIPI